MSTAQDQIGGQGQQAEEMIEELQERVSEFGEVVGQEAARLQRYLEARIREKPLQSVAIALGAGLLLAWLRRH